MKGGQSVLVAGRNVFGVDADGGWVSGTDGGVGGDRRDGGGLSRW